MKIDSSFVYYDTVSDTLIIMTGRSSIEYGDDVVVENFHNHFMFLGEL